MWKYRSSRSLAPSHSAILFSLRIVGNFVRRTLVTKVKRSTPGATPAAFPTALSLLARSSPRMYQVVTEVPAGFCAVTIASADPTAAELGNSLEINLTMRRTVILRYEASECYNSVVTFDRSLFLSREFAALFFFLYGYPIEVGKIYKIKNSIDNRLCPNQNFM